MVCCCSKSMYSLYCELKFTYDSNKNEYYFFMLVQYMKSISDSQAVIYKTEYYPVDFDVPLPKEGFAKGLESCWFTSSTSILCFGDYLTDSDLNQLYSKINGFSENFSLFGAVPSNTDYFLPLLNSSGEVVPNFFQNSESSLIAGLKNMNIPVQLNFYIDGIDHYIVKCNAKI